MQYSPEKKKERKRSVTGFEVRADVTPWQAETVVPPTDILLFSATKLAYAALASLFLPLAARSSSQAPRRCWSHRPRGTTLHPTRKSSI